MGKHAKRRLTRNLGAWVHGVYNSLEVSTVVRLLLTDMSVVTVHVMLMIKYMRMCHRIQKVHKSQTNLNTTSSYAYRGRKEGVLHQTRYADRKKNATHARRKNHRMRRSLPHSSSLSPSSAQTSQPHGHTPPLPLVPPYFCPNSSALISPSSSLRLSAGST